MRWMFYGCCVWVFWGGILFSVETWGGTEPTGTVEQGILLSLEEALSLAREQNPTIHQARVAVEEARGRALAARRIPMPELSATWTGIPARLAPGLAEEREMGLSQSLEWPGKRHTRARMGEMDVALAQWAFERTQRIVLAQVQAQYWSVKSAEAEITQLQSLQDLLSEAIQTALARYQAGEISLVDVLRFQVEQARLENDLIAARTRHAVQLKRLNLLLGNSPNTPLRLKDPLRFVPLRTTLEAFLEQSLRESRLLQMASARQRRANLSVQLARLAFRPNFRLGLFAYQGPLRGWSAEVSFEIPVWARWEQRGNLLEAQAVKQRVEIGYQALEQAIRESILSTWAAIQQALSQVKVFQTSLLRDTEDALEGAIAAYRFGRMGALDVLDTYRTYRATRLEYLRALAAYQKALAALEAAPELPQEEPPVWVQGE